MVSNVESKMVNLESGTTDTMIEAHEPDGLSPSPLKKSLFKRPWFIVLISFFVFLISIVIWLLLVVRATSNHLESVMTHSRAVMTAFTAKDLSSAQSELDAAKAALGDAQSSFNAVGPLRYVPLLGSYLKDADRGMRAGAIGIETGDLVVKAITPYADLMGFNGNTNSDEPKLDTAESRIIFVAETVEKLSPQMDEISAKLTAISQELEGINEKRYPRALFGHEIRSQIVNLKDTVKGAATSIGQFQPIIKLLPDLLGNPDTKKYLLIFQNDAELRPTGGFLTAYATMTITKGKIEPGISNDIYTLDAGFKKKVPAPDPIKKYLPLVYNWNLRDMNLSPDFKTSMDTFTSYMSEVPGRPDFDALIALDTQVPVRILEVLGPIGVPGYGGKFSAEIDPRCNCPQVIYELENIITRPTYEIREGRKSILGPLMNSMLANMMGSPKAKWAEFFNIFTESISQKHLLMYFRDPDMQEAAEALGAGGRINDYTGDYLHINDTNFAGAKSNMFVTNEVEQIITVNDDGSLTKKLTLTYKNPQPGSNCNLEAGELCLNGLLRNWQRVYVPEGSVLKSAKGFEVDEITSSDLGKTVFEGFFTLAPQSVKKLEIEYVTPAGTVKDLPAQAGGYKLLIQKQPGTKEVKHTISVNGDKAKVYTVNSDQEIVIPR